MRKLLFTNRPFMRAASHFLSVFLLMWVWQPAQSAPSPYMLYLPRICFELSQPAEQEPNDSRAQANGPLESGGSIYGVYSGSLDAYDIFYFDTDHSGTLRITLTNHPSTTLQLQLHTDTSLFPLIYDYQPPYQIEYNLRGAGRYYVAIYTPPGPPSNQMYVLTVTY